MKIFCVFISLLFFIPSLFALRSYLGDGDDYALGVFFTLFINCFWGVLGFYICHKEGA